MLQLPRELLSTVFSYLLPRASLLERKFRFNYFEHRRLVLASSKQTAICCAVCQDFRTATLPPTDLASPALQRISRNRWIIEDNRDGLLEWVELISASLLNRSSVLRLNLHGCSTLTTDLLMRILDGCSRLDRLDLNGCRSLDCKALLIVGAKCPQLTWLDLRGVVGAHDLAVKQMMADLTKGLEFLDLSHIWRISSLSLYSIAHSPSAKSIRRLMFAGNRAGSDGVVQLLNRCSFLKELDVAGNRDVNDSIIAGFQESELKWIDLRGTSVTETGTEEIIQTRPQLTLSIR